MTYVESKTMYVSYGLRRWIPLFYRTLYSKYVMNFRTFESDMIRILSKLNWQKSIE